MQLGMDANTRLAAPTSALEQKASWPQICIGDFFPAPSSHARVPPHTQLKASNTTKYTTERAGLVVPRYQISIAKADYLLIPSRNGKKDVSFGLTCSVNPLLTLLPQQAAKLLGEVY